MIKENVDSYTNSDVEVAKDTENTLLQEAREYILVFREEPIRAFREVAGFAVLCWGFYMLMTLVFSL